MMKSVRNLFVLALGSLAVLAACDSYEREEVTREIYVNKHEITLTVGQSDTLVVSPAAGQAQWHSEAEDIATVDADGVVKAVAAGKHQHCCHEERRKVHRRGYRSEQHSSH
ncbi:MAG: Ig domain-containing protein [Prevotella sp.]